MSLDLILLAILGIGIVIADIVSTDRALYNRIQKGGDA